jgi:hypothetical protein
MCYGKSTLTWWGYLHVNNTVQVKRFFGSQDITEARESDFVSQTVGPFEATDRANALDIVKERLGLG